jgi:Fur family peroxide stress response transcriptional regulator
MNTTANFQTKLKDNGMKSTAQRLHILNTLEELGHATLDKIYEESRPLFPTMSLTTIYRNINEMMEKNIIDEVKINGQKTNYEVSKKHHIHLVCKECGSIEDFSLDTSFIISRVEEQTGDSVVDSAIVMDVVCKKCKQLSSFSH